MKESLCVRCCLGLAALLSYAHAAAEPAASQAAKTATVSAGGLGAAWASTIAGLVVVIGLILVCAWLFKRLGGMAGNPSGVLQIVAVLPVGTREKVALLQVGEKQVLVGITPHQISLLQSFEQPVTVAGKKNDSEFATRLHALLTKTPET